MKRITTLLMIALYLIAISGITFSLHFCGGKFESFSFFSEAGKNCCGGKKMKSDCCKSKTVTVKLTENHQGNPERAVVNNSFTFVALFTSVEPFAFNELQEKYFLPNHHAPPDESPPLFLLNRNFRI
jgi:hypothetical protein